MNALAIISDSDNEGEKTNRIDQGRLNPFMYFSFRMKRSVGHGLVVFSSIEKSQELSQDQQEQHPLRTTLASLQRIEVRGLQKEDFRCFKCCEWRYRDGACLKKAHFFLEKMESPRKNKHETPDIEGTV